MALSPGTRLGSYEVTALIGQGGMGEVYKATDTRSARPDFFVASSSSSQSKVDRRCRRRFRTALSCVRKKP